MNERIRLLAEQAEGTKKHVPAVWQFYDYELEKFAKLIAQDCITEIALIGIGNWENDDIGWTVDLAIKNIREKFGVEDQKGWICPKCGVDRTKASCSSGHSAAITGECPMSV